MKVEIIKGTVNDGKETHGIGKTLDMGDKEAQGLIALGIIRKAGTGESKQASQENTNAQGGKSVGAGTASPPKRVVWQG